MKRYKIIKVLNNSVVSSVDNQGMELILRGKGIGVGKRPGEWIPEEKVERIYHMEDQRSNNKLAELLSKIPESYLAVSTEIIELAGKTLNCHLNENIYITLTDHIHFALYRKKEHMEYKNALLWEIRNFYPAEYQLGVRALEIIKKNLNEELSIDEAGFITHLKFFGQRLFQEKISARDDPVLFRMLKEQYFTDYHCAEMISKYIKETFGHTVSESEMIFLTIHLHRVSMMQNQ